MKNKYVIFALCPLGILVELLGFSYMVELVREPSDVAVFAAIALFCLLLACNYFLVKFLVSKFKTKTK